MASSFFCITGKGHFDHAVGLCELKGESIEDQQTKDEGANTNMLNESQSKLKIIEARSESIEKEIKGNMQGCKSGWQNF